MTVCFKLNPDCVFTGRMKSYFHSEKLLLVISEDQKVERKFWKMSVVMLMACIPFWSNRQESQCGEFIDKKVKILRHIWFLSSKQRNFNVIPLCLYPSECVSTQCCQFFCIPGFSGEHSGIWEWMFYIFILYFGLIVNMFFAAYILLLFQTLKPSMSVK